MSIKKRKSGAENYRVFSLWVSLVTVVVLISLLALFSLDSPTASAVQRISSLKAGGNLYFEIRGVEGLKDGTVYVDQNVQDVIIFFDGLPAIPSWFKGTFYSLFRVSSEDAAKLSSMDLTLKLRKERMQDLGLKKEDIKLYNNEGEILVQLASETGGYVSYLAHIPRLGDYVIGKSALSASSPEVSVKPSAPLAGQAIQTPSEIQEDLPQVPEEESLWMKIKRFFRNLWG